MAASVRRARSRDLAEIGPVLQHERTLPSSCTTWRSPVQPCGNKDSCILPFDDEKSPSACDDGHLGIARTSARSEPHRGMGKRERAGRPTGRCRRNQPAELAGGSAPVSRPRSILSYPARASARPDLFYVQDSTFKIGISTH